MADFDDVAVWIADVASRLAILVYGLREKRCASTLPQFVARLNVRDADIHEATDMIGIGRRAKRHRRFIRCGTAANVENEPCVGDFDVRRCVSVAHAHNFSIEDRFVEFGGSLEVGHSEKVCDRKPLHRWHLIVLLLDLYFVHRSLQFRAVIISLTLTTAWSLEVVPDVLLKIYILEEVKRRYQKDAEKSERMQ